MNEKKDQKKKYLFYWLICFFIISVFSYSKDGFLDEFVSLRCSLNFIGECLSWDTQSPIYYFFLRNLLYFSSKIEVLRLFHALLISFSIIIIIKALSKFKNFSITEELIILLSFSFLPVVYSSVLLRPYSLSFLFAAFSIYYFLLYIKTKDKKNLNKSLLLDSFGFLIFYFNILILIPKLLYIFFFNKKFFNNFFFLIAKNFLPSILIMLIYLYFLFANFNIFETWKHVIKHYEDFKIHYLRFLFNFPIELYKEQTVYRSTFFSAYSLLFKFLAQIIFFYPLITFLKLHKKNEFLSIYVKTFLTILFFNISFSIITSKYLILSRHFIFLSLYLIVFLLLFLKKTNKIFLLTFLPLSFIDYTIFYRLQLILNEGYIYFPIFEIIENIPSNSEIIITPFYISEHFWYYESFRDKKNITILDTLQIDWYKKDYEEKISLRKWNTNISNIFQSQKIIIPNYRNISKADTENLIKIFLDISDAKNVCKNIVKEIKKFETYILICI